MATDRPGIWLEVTDRDSVTLALDRQCPRMSPVTASVTAAYAPGIPDRAAPAGPAFWDR